MAVAVVVAITVVVVVRIRPVVVARRTHCRRRLM
jgi:hypothetical protein